MDKYIYESIFRKLESIEKILIEIKKSGTISITMEPDPKLIKIDEAAIITGYSKKYLYILVHKKIIPFYKRGKAIRFDPETLREWMRNNNIQNKDI